MCGACQCHLHACHAKQTLRCPTKIPEDYMSRRWKYLGPNDTMTISLCTQFCLCIYMLHISYVCKTLVWITWMYCESKYLFPCLWHCFLCLCAKALLARTVAPLLGAWVEDISGHAWLLYTSFSLLSELFLFDMLFWIVYYLICQKIHMFYHPNGCRFIKAKR